MFRFSFRAVIGAAMASYALAATDGVAASVALVCDGEFRMQRASVEGVTEINSAGTMHVALVAEQDSVVEIRLQTFEDGKRTPVQTFALPPMEAEPETGDMALLFPELFIDATGEDDGASDLSEVVATPGTLTIDTSEREVVLRHVVESGPIIKARVNGRPLVPTREKIETIEMRIDRSSGDMNLVWGEDSVRDHRRAGAIRTSKIQLRDEKSYRAVCLPVRQRAF
jgi:hypothetical protein